jgi:Arc/MetJ-type ribon-helix-helix transcriptional regulator
MPQVEVFVPDQVDAEIEQLVEQGEFISRGEAVEELLTIALTTYSQDANEDEGDLEFADEMQNPGDRLEGSGDDDYAF